MRVMMLMAFLSATLAHAALPEDAVVRILVDMGTGPGGPVTGRGTGTFISSDGRFLTALHVINNGRGIKLIASDSLDPVTKDRISRAVLEPAYWESRERDLVVLRFKPPNDNRGDFPFLPLATQPAAQGPARFVRNVGSGTPVVRDTHISKIKKSVEPLDFLCSATMNSICPDVRPFASNVPFPVALIDAAPIKGYSGSPLLNAAGEITAVIVLRAADDGVAVGVVGAGVPVRAEHPLPHQSAFSAPTMSALALSMVVTDLGVLELDAVAHQVYERCPAIASLMEAVHNLEALSLVEEMETTSSAALSPLASGPERTKAIHQAEQRVRQQAESVAQTVGCGSLRRNVPTSAAAFIATKATARHLGSLRTLWTSTREALITPSPRSRPRWITRSGIFLNPVEALLVRRIPGAAQLLIKDTRPCDIFAVLAGNGLSPPGATCSEDVLKRMSALMEALRFGETLQGGSSDGSAQDAGPPEERTWLDLALDPAAQARLWRGLLDSGVLEPLAVLAFASNVSPLVLEHRNRVLSREIDGVQSTRADIDRFLKTTSALAFESARQAREHTTELNGAYTVVPEDIRQARSLPAVLRSYCQDEILIPGFSDRTQSVSIEEQLDTAWEAADATSRALKSLVTDLVTRG